MNAPCSHKELSSSAYIDADRWNAFRTECAKPWSELTPAWQDFFYLMGDDKNCTADALDAALDKAREAKQ